MNDDEPETLYTPEYVNGLRAELHRMKVIAFDWEQSAHEHLAGKNAALAECDALRDLLKELEWQGGRKEMGMSCPSCGWVTGHGPGCKLAAALAKHSGGTK